MPEKTLSISYDLRAPGRDYESLYEAIKNESTTWCHPLESTWFIRTTASAEAVARELLRHLDANDGLVVGDAGGAAAWFGVSNPVGEWLHEHY